MGLDNLIGSLSSALEARGLASPPVSGWITSTFFRKAHGNVEVKIRLILCRSSLW
jgi:hypothetical protein